MTIYQRLQDLQKMAQSAYEAGAWKLYDRVTDEYMKTEDENCTCPKKLSVVVDTCKAHSNVCGMNHEASESGQSELLLIIMIAIVAVVIYVAFQPVIAALFAGLPK